MTASRPFVADTSVVLTCFNEKHYIVDAIRSILAQTLLDRVLEIIVVDDGSTDGSIEVLEDLARKEPRVRLIQSGGRGVSAARNLALRDVSGTYVAFLDGDDTWSPDKLEQQLPILERFPTVGLVYSDFYEFDDGHPEQRQRSSARRYKVGYPTLLADYYVFDAPVIPSSIITRKSVLDEIGPFSTDLRVGEDTDFCLRVAERYDFQHVPAPLVMKRRHAGALTSRQDRLWANQVRITEIFAERNPALKKLARKRLSWRAAKVGWGMVQVRDRMSAMRYLARSLRYDPVNTRAYAYLGLALVPQSLAMVTHRFAGRLRGRYSADAAS